MGIHIVLMFCNRFSGWVVYSNHKFSYVTFFERDLMTTNDVIISDPRPAGYLALARRYSLEVIANWHESFVATSGMHRVETNGAQARETYPPAYWPGEALGDHLEFALKYDGTNLAILSRLFDVIDQTEFTDYVQSKLTSKYARRLWFLYEFLTGKRLNLDDIKQGNYVDLIDPKKYVTTTQTIQVRRQRIRDNLLGDSRFCPMIRYTDTLQQFEATDLRKRCEEVVASYSQEMLKRALSYLYTKETKSSFEIEHVKASPTRIERFISLLQLAEHEDFCDKPHLIDLQNRIVDPRFRDNDYRKSQNYVGETVAWQQEKIHFACPKPEDLHNLMDGLIAAHERMNDSRIHPIIHSAVIAYGFVFLHPFEDGNGRIHRFLIHNILARRGFTPQGIMFPVSAAMLKNPAEYDASLETFSQQLMPLVDYLLDEDGRMTVQSKTANWYRYIDMTPQVEALFAFIEKTINTELVEELVFLKNYDQTKQAIQAIVDMPDRQIDLFIRFCLQNNGKLSARKRTSHFSFLAEDEIEQMEKAVQAAYGGDASCSA